MIRPALRVVSPWIRRGSGVLARAAAELLTRSAPKTSFLGEKNPKKVRVLFLDR